MNVEQGIPFVWSPLEVSGRTIERAAILLEATLPGLNMEGYLQFDLGIPRTVIYARAFSEEMLQPYRLSQTEHLLGKDRPVLDLSVEIGAYSLSHPLLLEEQESGEYAGRPILGSLGADAVRHAVLVLDFPHQRLALLDRLPDAWKSDGFFAPMEIDTSGRPVLYAQHHGRTVRLLYDTGSSPFGLLTSRDRWAQLTDGKVTETLNVPSWGNVVHIEGARLQHPLRVGSLNLSVDTVYVVDMPGLKVVLDRMHALGITGNRPFWEHILILDFLEQRWGVCPTETRRDPP